MKMRYILWVIIAISLTACRANSPRPDSGPYGSPAPIVEPGSPKVQAATGGSYLPGDGPGADTPANLDQVADAVPRDEPLHRYANRPYTALGTNYTPLTSIGGYKERGIASWYGKKFHGQKTSIGEVYDMYGMTAAHTTLPIPSYARVTNLNNHRSIIVRINDRGPFLRDRIIDLSYTAASKLGIIANGQGPVEVESLTAADLARTSSAPIYKEPLNVAVLSPDTRDTGKVYLQLGAFKSQRGAEEFLGNMRTKLSETGKKLSLANKNGLIKVRIGPYSSKDSARTTASKIESLVGIKPMLSVY